MIPFPEVPWTIWSRNNWILDSRQTNEVNNKHTSVLHFELLKTISISILLKRKKEKKGKEKNCIHIKLCKMVEKLKNNNYLSYEPFPSSGTSNKRLL